MKYPESQTPPDDGQGIWSSALITTLRVVIDWRDKYVLFLNRVFTSLSLWWLFQVVACGFYRYSGSRFKQMALFTIERLSSH